VSYTSTARAWG